MIFGWDKVELLLKQNKTWSEILQIVRGRDNLQYLYRYLEPETIVYCKLNPSAIPYDINTNIRSIKYGFGISLTTQTMNLSTVNGTAFITNPLTDLRPYLGYKATITAGGKTLVGWIKAAGTGETYGTDVLPSGQAASDARAEGNSIAGYYNCGTLNTWESSVVSPLVGSYNVHVIADTNEWCQINKQFGDAVVNGAIYRNTHAIKVISGSVKWYLVWPSIYITYNNQSYIQYAYYRTMIDTSITVNIVWANENGTEFYIDNTSYQQVLTPSATGVTVVSEKGGTTYNWASNDGIDPNSASFTVVITAS